MSNSSSNPQAPTVTDAIHTFDKVQRITRNVLHVAFVLALTAIFVLHGVITFAYSPAKDDTIYTCLAFSAFLIALVAAMEIGSTLNLTGYGNPMGAFNVLLVILFGTVTGAGILMLFGSILTLDNVLPPEYVQYMHVYYGFEQLGASILSAAGLLAVMMIIIETVEHYWPNHSSNQPLNIGAHV